MPTYTFSNESAANKAAEQLRKYDSSSEIAVFSQQPKLKYDRAQELPKVWIVSVVPKGFMHGYSRNDRLNVV